MENINWVAAHQKYKDGMTMKQVANHYGCSYCAIRANFKKLNLKIRSKSESKTGTRHPRWKGEFLFRENGRKCVLVNGRRVHAARVVYCECHNLKEIPKGMHVHHIDFDCTNDDPVNLELLTAGKHKILHLHRKDQIFLKLVQDN